MTLDELKAMDKSVIPPKIAALFLRCDPYSINVQAKKCPDQLGFPVTMIGNRVKIPRLAFIKYLEG